MNVRMGRTYNPDPSKLTFFLKPTIYLPLKAAISNVCLCKAQQLRPSRQTILGLLLLLLLRLLLLAKRSKASVAASKHSRRSMNTEGARGDTPTQGRGL